MSNVNPGRRQRRRGCYVQPEIHFCVLNFVDYKTVIAKHMIEDVKSTKKVLKLRITPVAVKWCTFY